MLWRNPITSAGPGASRTSILPKLRPQVPSAGHFGGDSWLKLHEAHVNTVQTNQGPADVLLVGDSITEASKGFSRRPTPPSIR